MDASGRMLCALAVAFDVGMSGTAAVAGSAPATGVKFHVFYVLPAPGTIGASPSPLIRGSDGNFYGVNEFGSDGTHYGTFFSLTPKGAYDEVYRFAVGANDLFAPLYALTEGSDHAFYGSAAGGTFSSGGAFRITSTGDYSALTSYPEGTEWDGPLVEAADGNLYGSSHSGGKSGCGFVFRFPRSGGTTSVFHEFDCASGDSPNDGMTVGPDGALYGTTNGNTGVLYRLGLDGSFSVVHKFDGATECGTGDGAPVFDSRGNLYGTCSGGEVSAIVYQIDLAGRLATLHTFDGSRANALKVPVGRLTVGSDGMLYGCTVNNGSNAGGGVYRVSRSGRNYEALHVFKDPAKDGDMALGPPVEGAPGTFYGANYGPVFQGSLWKVVP